jgi:predicted CoA-binding protein
MADHYPIEHTDDYPKAYLQQILSEVKTIALVGASAKPERDSYLTMQALLQAGYTVLPVNPFETGNKILGQICHGTLTDIQQPIDMVDIFRSAEAVLGITDEAIAIGAQVIWMQLGIINQQAHDRAIAAGLKVIMNRCPKLELAKLLWTTPP